MKKELRIKKKILELRSFVSRVVGVSKVCVCDLCVICVVIFLGIVELEEKENFESESKWFTSSSLSLLIGCCF